MIQIYCLINPYNNKPFYVGATKLALSKRLSAHINSSLSVLRNYWNRKDYLINYLHSNGKKPRIKTLFRCSLIEVDHYEEFFYKMLQTQGFRLLQENSFSYSRKHQFGKLINQHSKLNRNKLAIVKIN